MSDLKKKKKNISIFNGWRKNDYYYITGIPYGQYKMLISNSGEKRGKKVSTNVQYA